MNKNHEDRLFSISVNKPQEVTINVQNNELDNLKVVAQEVKSFKVFATLKEDLVAKNTEGKFLISLTIRDLKDNKEYDLESIFVIR